MRLGTRPLAAFWLLLLASLTPAQERLRDVIYLKAGGCAYTMDVFKPATPNHAAVIFLVSGGWFSSHDNINPEVAKPFTDAGFTVFEVVHGSQPKFVMPEIVGQLQHALRFIHSHGADYGVDPNRLGLFGASAGGHLTLLLSGTSDAGNPDAKNPVDRAPDSVACAVAFYPPTDFKNWGGPGISSFHVPQLGIFMPAFGVNPATPEDAITKLDASFSPIHHVTSSFPPTLLLHGDEDALVPVQQSKVMDAELTARGVVHELVIVPHGKHDIPTFLGGLPAALKWFQEHLK
jgi:acetyl esterase/lipase